MSQESVYRLLKKKREWMATKELEKLLDVGHSSIWSALNKLKKHGEIKFKKDSLKKGRHFLWKVE